LAFESYCESIEFSSSASITDIAAVGVSPAGKDRIARLAASTVWTATAAQTFGT
jgi:hypothetical protein